MKGDDEWRMEGTTEQRGPARGAGSEGQAATEPRLPRGFSGVSDARGGEIQPFGALVVFTPEWRVSRCSANVETTLGIAPDALLGRSCAEALGPAIERAAREAAAQPAIGAYELGRIEAPGAAAALRASLHAEGDGWRIELVPVSAPADAELAVRLLHEASTLIAAAPDVEAFGRFAARALRRMTAADRVVVVRIDPRSVIEVIAEARADALTPWLGLQEPGEGAPAPAPRERVIAIADVEAAAVPMIAADAAAEAPIAGLLRAPSPALRERLRAAGARAAVTAAIVCDGRLWGVVECQHHAPRAPVAAELSLIGALAEMLGVQAARAEAEARRRRATDLAEPAHAIVAANVSDAVILVDLDGVVTFWNEAARRIFGWAAEEIVGRRVREFFADRDRPALLRRLAAVRDGRPIDFESTVHAKDGTTRWIEAHARLFHAPDGARRGYCGIFRDITERKRAERALRESEARFQVLADSASVLIWMADVDGHCTYFNQTWLRFTGRSLAEESGDGWSAGVHPDDREACVSHYREAFVRREPFQIEYRLRRHDGEYRWLLDSGVPRFAADGTFEGYIGTCIDITERRESEERFRSLAECLPDGLFVLDPEDREVSLRILYANRAASEINGYPVEQLVGRSIVALLDEPGMEAVAEARAQLIRGGETITFESVARHRDGHLVPLEVRGLLIPWQGRSAILGIDRDLSERKRSEAAIAEVAQRLSLALECGQLGVWDWDVPSGRIVWDERHARLFGVTLAEFDGTYAGAVRRIHPDDLAALEATISAAFLRGEAYAYEFRIVLPDGAVRWIAGRGLAQRSGDAVVRALGFVQDVTARREAEEALRASNRLYKLLTGAMQDAVGLVSPGGLAAYVSPSVQRLLGWTAEELTGKAAVDWIHPEERAALEQAFAEVLAGREVRLACRFRHRDGHWVPLESNMTPLFDEAGRLTGIVSCARDVTARERAEEAMRKAHRRYEELVGAIDGIVWEADAQTFRFLFVSQAAERMLGYPLERWLEPDFWRDHLHPDDRDAAVQYCLDCLEQGLNHQFEYRMIARDGRVVWIQDSVTILSHEGAPRLMRGILLDITERKRIEESERAIQERFELAAESAGIGVWDLDLVRETLIWDDRMLRIYGVDRAEFGGTYEDWKRLVHPEDLPRVIERGQRAIDARASSDVEFRIVWPSGEVRHVRSFGKIVCDASGAPIRRTGINIDISERKRIEEQRREMELRLRQSQKLEAIGQLAGGVAHDFNNLLMIITLSTQQLVEGALPDTPEYEALEAIREAGARGAALTRQLLAFGRKQVLKVEVVDPNAVVAQVGNMLGRLLGEDIRCVVQLAPDVRAIRADVTQLDQILINLAVNARDAMPRGGTLTISTADETIEGPSPAFPEAQPGAYVRLTVADTGTGMDEATRARIFEPFFTTKEPGKGTGLGLSTVYGIVKQFSGHIAVDTAIGRGSTFTLLFPAAEPERRHPRTRARAPAERGSETILIVEDDASVRRITTRLLERRGYQVIAAADGPQALQLCERPSPPIDLLITDVVMPGMGGTAVAEALRAKIPGLKVIFISGYNDDMVLRHGIEHEKVPFLQKPFTADALTRLVRATLGGEDSGLLRVEGDAGRGRPEP